MDTEPLGCYRGRDFHRIGEEVSAVFQPPTLMPCWALFAWPKCHSFCWPFLQTVVLTILGLPTSSLSMLPRGCLVHLRASFKVSG